MTFFAKKPLERRKRDHMSRQFTYVVHASDINTPPHEAEGSLISQRVHPLRNIHEEAFHAGTPESASDTGRYRALHVYKIDRSVMDPIVWGDEDILEHEGALDSPGVRGVSPQLFESKPLLNPQIDRNIRSKNPLVQVYRNAAEDTGSLSFIIPKGLVGNGVQYLGRRKRDFDR